MKQIFKLASLLAVGVLLNSCSESTGIEESAAALDENAVFAGQPKTRTIDVAELTFDGVKEYLGQCGYDTTNLTEHEEYYLIGSDMGFSKERLAEAMSEPETRMVTVGKLLGKEYYRLNLTLYWGSDYNVTTYFTKAVDEWNKIEGCCLDFASNIHNNTNYKRLDVPVYIQEDPPYTSSVNMIHVEMPLRGKPGGIYINTNTKQWKAIDANQRQYAIMHALGHLVGCDHYKFDGSQYPDTMFDPSSIMQDEVGLNDNNMMWQGFTQWDIDALQKMYKLEPATYELACLPEITGSDSRRMEIGKEYKLTASYNYDWVFNPTYTYEVWAASGVVDYSMSGNELKIKFIKGGACTVSVTIQDAYGEKQENNTDYTFEITYRAYDDQPTFTYPSSIKLGEYATFKMTFNNPDYKTVTYKYTVQEEFFDDNTDRSVDIQQDGKGTARIRFNDYGKYRVKAVAEYGGKRSEYLFGYTKLYRPETLAYPGGVENWQQQVMAELPEYSQVPTGDNLIRWCSVHVKFGKTDLLQHRVVCDLQDDQRMQYWCPPQPVFYRILKVKSRRRLVLQQADSAYVSLPPDKMYYHPDSINYKGHVAFIYPLAWVYYPGDDFCGILSK